MKRNIAFLLIVSVILNVFSTLVYASDEILEENINYHSIKLIKEPWKNNLCPYPFYNHLDFAGTWLDNAIDNFTGEELKNYLYIEKLPINDNFEPIKGLAIGFTEDKDGTRQKIEFVLNPRSLNFIFKDNKIHVEALAASGIRTKCDFNYLLRDGRTYICTDDVGIFNMLLSTFAIAKGLEDYPKLSFDEETLTLITKFNEETFKIKPSYTLAPQNKTILHIPLRELFEKLGYIVYWDQNTKSIVIM